MTVAMMAFQDATAKTKRNVRVNYFPDWPLYRDLAVGVGIGLLFGVERGWSGRFMRDGTRVAGLRTFGILAIVGAAAGWLTRFNQAPLGIAIAAGAALLIVAGYVIKGRHESDVSATTEVAAIAALLLAAMATLGWSLVAAALAITAVTLLAARETLHEGVAALNEQEIFAALRFLVLAAIILPLLPNRDLGPYGALNPFDIGFIVVLLSGLSFAGYWAVRWRGERQGLLLTAAFGGLVSSTAVTMSLSRLSKSQTLNAEATAAAIAVASQVMLVRVLLLSAAVAWPAFDYLLLPVGAALLTGLAITAFYWTRGEKNVESRDGTLSNPFELRPAFAFAAVLAVVTLATRWAAAHHGASGLIAVSAITGLVDADSVIIANGRFAATGGAPLMAAAGILAAIAVNSVSKSLIALATARPDVARLVVVQMGAALGAGILVWALA